MKSKEDEGVARLLARSDAILRRCRDVNERSARVSARLSHLLAQCDGACEGSRRLYEGAQQEAETPPELGPDTAAAA